MTWVDQVHTCNLPTRCQFRPKLDSLFECDYCKRTWRVNYVHSIDDSHHRVGYKLFDPYKYHDYIS